MGDIDLVFKAANLQIKQIEFLCIQAFGNGLYTAFRL